MFFQLILAFVLVWQCLASQLVNLPPPKKSYKILMLLPFSSVSHRNCFWPLAEALTERGHEVSILAGEPPKKTNPKIKEYTPGIRFINDSLNMFEQRENDPTKGFSIFKILLPEMARDMYKVSEVRKLYDQRHEFDMFILDELFNEPAYPFLENRKYIALSTTGFQIPSSATLGNVLNPAYIPGIAMDFKRPYTFLQRVFNLFSHVFFPYSWRHRNIFPSVHKELNQHFPNFPPLAEIEKNLVLILGNTYFAINAPIPLLPSQIETGGMHCRPSEKLPHDLETFIKGAGQEGVIYFSLGSVAKSKSIPEKYKKTLLETFKTLKQRIIWKFEDDFKDLPKNILIKKWMPQQDILGHPNVKLFITHGGLLSMQEALYHGTPLLAMPIFGDQEKNAETISNKNFGRYLYWEDLTVEKLSYLINEILSNKIYQETVKKTGEVFRDQPQKPVEKAVWWTEYVIRHNGAPQLRSPGADISWVEYLMLDVILAIHVVVFVLYFVFKKLFIKIISATFSKSDKNLKTKRA